MKDKIRSLQKQPNGTYYWLKNSWLPLKKRSGYFVTIREFKGYLGKNEYAGVWKDPKTNLVYLDVVIWVPNKETALKIGKDKKQLAIWDIKQQKEIWIYNYEKM